MSVARVTCESKFFGSSHRVNFEVLPHLYCIHVLKPPSLHDFSTFLSRAEPSYHLACDAMLKAQHSRVRPYANHIVGRKFLRTLRSEIQ